jgi:hypothetical protein
VANARALVRGCARSEQRPALGLQRADVSPDASLAAARCRAGGRLPAHDRQGAERELCRSHPGAPETTQGAAALKPASGQSGASRPTPIASASSKASPTSPKTATPQTRSATWCGASGSAGSSSATCARGAEHAAAPAALGVVVSARTHDASRDSAGGGGGEHGASDGLNRAPGYVRRVRACTL